MLVHHEHDPGDADRDEQDRERPRRRERLVEQGGLAVELAPAGDERGEDEREEDRLLVVQALDQRGDDPGSEQGDGEKIGRVEAALQPARQQQEAEACKAAGEMRYLDERQRDNVAQPPEPAVRRGGRARNQQDGAGEEGRRRERVRDERRRPPAEDAADADGVLATRRDFVAGKEQHREHEWEHVVDEAVCDERSEQRRRREREAEEHDDTCLKDSESGGDGAEDAGDLGDEERPRDRLKRKRRIARQQHEEHRRREEPVERRNPDLGYGETGAWQAELPLAPTDRGGAQSAERDVGHDDCQCRESSRAARRGRERHGRGEWDGARQQDPAQHRQEAEPERGGIEDDDFRDLRRRQSPRRVQPITHRTAAQERGAQIVAERVADEGSERDAQVGELGADERKSQSIVAGEGEVAANGQHECERDAPPRNGTERGDHLVPVIGVQLTAEHLDRDCEQQDAEQGRHEPAEARHSGHVVRRQSWCKGPPPG